VGADEDSIGFAPEFEENEDGHRGRPVMLVARKGRDKRERRERIVTARVVMYALFLVGLLGGIGGTVGWFVENAYYVGLSHNEVVIYHGRPGGLLWFQPSLIDHTRIYTNQIIPPLLPTLRAGVQEETLAEAESFVKTLTQDQSLLPLFSDTTTVPASTVPGGPTTTAPPVASSIPTQQTQPTFTFTPPSTSAPAATTTTTPRATTTTTPPTTTTTKGKGKGKGKG
jgi:hypothetical protein